MLMTSNAPTVHHVSPDGDDRAGGNRDRPLRTIQAAADRAQPGEVIEVHAGLYRERVDPPRGGTSPELPIVYRAAPGESVEIRGSEVVNGWRQIEDGLWTVEVDASLFGDFNPFADEIRGDWFVPCGRPHHTGAVYLDGEWLLEAPARDAIAPGQWFAEVESDFTRIFAHLDGCDPRDALTEIHVRPTVFYPSRPGINYLTVRGFTMRHAATNWAPPTSGQVGLLGTHWSKGWLIEHNTLSHSRCVGLTLGKYGDAHDNTSADSAEGYVATIERALACGWDRSTVGSHRVRHNHIHHCEQAGIAGSLGAIFSEITDNLIHHIHVQRLFEGMEQAGIKLHAAIDCLVARNRIHDTFRALWFDWMTQGSRISRNWCFNSHCEDLFVEVNHGPFLVDNNAFLSRVSLLNWSQGGAYVHNLFGGEIHPRAEPRRETPFHPPHETTLAGLASIRGGDDRFWNNLLPSPDALDASLAARRQSVTGRNEEPRWEEEVMPSESRGNLALSQPLEFQHRETDDPAWTIHLDAKAQPAVDPGALGKTRIAGLPYLNPDGTQPDFSQDLLGERRHGASVLPGPFANGPGPVRIPVPVGQYGVSGAGRQPEAT